MDMLDALKKLGKAREFESSKNYYFEKHVCKNGEEIKVMLDLTLSNDNDEDILRIGLCPKCGKLYYHKDYISKY